MSDHSNTAAASCADVPLVEISNATVYRGETRVFDRFSLTLQQGVNTVILGPNGAGKTTLLKLVTRELYPVSSSLSSVRVLGRLRGDVWSLRSQLGLISNDLQHEYAPYVTGLEVVLSGYYSSVGTWAHQAFSEDQRRHGSEILEWLGIEGLSERRFGTLSTGQQRRLLMGRALVNKPANLILDEPTSGLDLSATFQYLDTMRRLMAEERTLVLVTHHIHEIPPEIGRVVLMKDGEVVADGPKPTVLTQENLSELFGTPVRLVSANGWYQAVPG